MAGEHGAAGFTCCNAGTGIGNPRERDGQGNWISVYSPL